MDETFKAKITMDEEIWIKTAIVYVGATYILGLLQQIC